METLLLEADVAIHSAPGCGGVTRAMLRQRAVELAVSNGRSAETVAKADWEQAKRELTMSRAEPHDQVPALEPELERWENEGGEIPESAGL